MKRSLLPLLVAGSALLFAAGCASNDTKGGPYAPQTSTGPALEGKEPVVLMDPGVQYSVTQTGIQEQVLPDGRLKVTVHFRNRENRRIEVQANCVFKDQNGYSTGDETPWQAVILTENSTEDVSFVSANNQARKYTIRVRQAR
jgi:hypothetical protein